MERNIEYVGVLVIRVYASEVLWLKANVDVLAELFSCKVVFLELVSVIYGIV